MATKPLLTISILVSNRPDTIEKCLKSLDSLRKNVPCELILTDTGCGPEVREIIEKYADKIIDFEWCDDFAKARNVGLKQARGQWFMFLDDDEWFEDTDDIEQFFLTDLHNRYNFGEYYARNYINQEGTRYADSVAARVVKLFPDVEFEYAVHESLKNMRTPVIRFRSYVHHYGYVYKSYEDCMKHSRRNVILLEKELKKNPHNLHHILQLAQEYKATEDWKSMLSLAEEGIRVHGSDTKSRVSVFGLYVAVLRANISLKKYEDAIACGEKYLQENDLNDLARAAIENMLCRAYYGIGDYEKSIDAIKKYMEIYEIWKQNKSKYINYENLFLNFCFDEEGVIAAYGTAVRVELARNNVKAAKGYFVEMDWHISDLWVFWPMVEIMEETTRSWLKANLQQISDLNDMMKVFMQSDVLKATVLNYLKRWRLEEPELLHAENVEWGKWEEEDWLFLYLKLWNHQENQKEDLMQKYLRMWMERQGCLADSFELDLWDMAEQDEINMEVLIGKLPFYYWQSAVAVACSNKKEDVLDRLQGKFSQFHSMNSFHMLLWRSAYKLRKLQWLCEKEPKMTDVIEELLEYAELTYSLYQGMYRKELFEDGQALLPQECQLSIKLLAMRNAIEQQQYSGAIACVKDALRIMPKLSEVLKYCSMWIDELVAKQHEEQEQANNEMQMLAVAVKKQVRNLLSQNMLDEAQGILQQLRTLVPNDAELQELETELQRRR